MKAFFVKDILAASNFINFSNLKIFGFFAKKTHNQGTKDISKRKDRIIWYAFFQKFSIFTYFEKSKSSKKPTFFQKKTKLSTYLVNFTNSVAFYNKFAGNWWKQIFKFRIVQAFWHFQLEAERWSNARVEWVILFSYFKYRWKTIISTQNCCQEGMLFIQLVQLHEKIYVIHLLFKFTSNLGSALKIDKKHQRNLKFINTADKITYPNFFLKFLKVFHANACSFRYTLFNSHNFSKNGSTFQTIRICNYIIKYSDSIVFHTNFITWRNND